MWLETTLLYILTIFLIFVSTLYIYFKYQYTYWTKENVPHLLPQFPFGNAKSIVTMTDSFGNCFKTIYDDIKRISDNFGGFYMFSRPSIILIEPELIKHIITKDFAHFHDRGMYLDEDSDPLGAHLVALKGMRWKNSRAKITPTFTSGKIKMMFHTILSTSKELNIIIDQHIKDNEALDTRDIFARLATDTIGSCAFGLDCNSLKDPNVEFRKYGNKVFKLGIREALINMIASNFPFILRMFKIPQTAPDVTAFFMNVLKQTIEYRETNNIQRKDFLNLLIRLKNNQSVLDEQIDTKDTTEGITFNELAAHAFVFFAAGFETSSSTLNFCLFELTTNLEIQEKTRQEVIDVLSKFNEEFSYEAITSMKYMDKVLNEVLRKYPPIPMLERECTKDYKIPNSNYVIKKGTEVVISTLGLQRDPDHYPDPDKFDPERFSEEGKSKRHPYTYLPFGEGPRVCIGMRFALMQAKVVLAVLLMNYRFSLDPKTVTPVTFSPTSVFLCPQNTFWLKATKL